MATNNHWNKLGKITLTDVARLSSALASLFMVAFGSVSNGLLMGIISWLIGIDSKLDK